jgi:hypothetical protein
MFDQYKWLEPDEVEPRDDPIDRDAAPVAGLSSICPNCHSLVTTNNRLEFLQRRDSSLEAHVVFDCPTCHAVWTQYCFLKIPLTYTVLEPGGYKVQFTYVVKDK